LNSITEEKLAKYFAVTEEAFAMAKKHVNAERAADASDVLDMVARYISDAKHFREQQDVVNAFAALNYAHGWLDCAARTGILTVKNSRLFTVDD